MRPLAAFLLLIAGFGCRDANDPDDRMFKKPVEVVAPVLPSAPPTIAPDPVTPPPTPRATDPELERDRQSYSEQSRQRMDRLEQRLRELDEGADATARDAAAELRARKLQLETKLRTAGDQLDANWDEFKADVGVMFENIERDLDRVLH